MRNRIPKLVSELDAWEAKREKTGMAMSEAVGNLFQNRMVREAPVGKVEPSFSTKSGRLISHGRPSLRQHGVTLKGGWLPVETFSSKRLQHAVISTSAPHVRPLINKPSKKSWLIPRRPTGVSFYWYRQNRGAWYPQVRRQAARQNDFVQRSVDKERSTARFFILDAMTRSLGGVRAVIGG